jgi:hypothetical protein
VESRVIDLGGLAVLLLDSLDLIPNEQADLVLVTGSHGGLDSARRVLRRPPRLAIFNDAGVGKDAAGIAGLELLEAFHIPAATVDVHSARIGDATDCLESGIFSHCNARARALGVEVGLGVRDLLQTLHR